MTPSHEPDAGRYVWLSSEQYRERFGRDPDPWEPPTEPWPFPGAWHGWAQPWPPPTVVVVMAEHGDAVLWNRSPVRATWLDDYVLAPDVLGLSARLAERLRDWNDRYPAGSRSGTWVDEGWALAHDVQREFDARGLDVEVRYHDGDGSEPAVRGRRRN